MPIHDDYYKILQVHILAEPEVIESAYKRLARKYHPDICKQPGAADRMKKLNEAYETLRDMAKRREYDNQRQKKPEPQQAKAHASPAGYAAVDCPAGAKAALMQYFDCLKKHEFANAYKLITAMDKSNITEDDFIRWQQSVSRIYSLEEYKLKAEKKEIRARLGTSVFDMMIEFSVETVEQNFVMGRLERDQITKKVVQEGNAFRVYVGMGDIRPNIERFEALNNMLLVKSVVNDMAEYYSLKDISTGLYNKKGFTEAAQREIMRYARYGNKFSVMLLELTPLNLGQAAKNTELMHYTAEWAGRILADNFRKLDIIGRLGDTGFIILLPETDINDCIKAAKKAKRLFEKSPLVFNKKTYTIKLIISAEEFAGSMTDTMQNLNNYLAIAVNKSRNVIVTKRGIYE